MIRLNTYLISIASPLKFIGAVILFLTSGTHHLKAQTAPQSEDKVKAVFLYNFTRFIDWPSSAFASNEQPFKIGIMGEDPFGIYLEEAIRNEKYSGRPIIIEKFENAKDIKDCHMIFINTKNQKEIKNILNNLENKTVLTIAEHPEFVKWGGMIRLYSDDRKIRIQINDAAARLVKIKVSAKLLNIADVYYP